MKQRKQSFRHESLQDAKTIQALLEAVTDGIAKGKVTFSDEDAEIVLKPKGLLNLKLTASRETERHQIGIKISWQVEKKGSKKKKSLSVSSK